MRARLRQWALKRQGQDVLPLALAARRVYILPTPAGWTFALLLATMFIAGMNYGNGLALLFTFWLTGFALVAMVQTQRGLSGLRLLSAEVQPVHAGDNLTLRITVSGKTSPLDLRLRTGEEAPSLRPVKPGVELIPDNATDSVCLTFPATRRGRWQAPALHLSSTAPFGLFRTWTWLSIELSTLVYPAPAGTRPMPENPEQESGSVRLHQGLDELAWLRDFREGDSPRQVAWKAYARGQPLLVREYHGAGAQRREFDFEMLAGMDVESRLSQLTRWVSDAAARGEGWVLRLPGAAPMSGEGRDHLTRCLERLALHGQPG
ncbi:MAG TPA: DUF58 domain-containing protein [Steroidobacteraceae bacterium]|nr:DUF58 domain-containing protein [Steroidobacteraceae bacterium]